MGASSTTYGNADRLRRCLVAALFAAAAAAAEPAFDWNGHVKTRLLGQWFPRASVFRDFAGASAQDIQSDLRLTASLRSGGMSAEAAYQLIGFAGDTVEYTRELDTGSGVLPPRLPDDRRRLFDLTATITDEGRVALVHRLDRLAATWTTERTVIRLGRQVLSWGNGLYFAPLDIVNPFDPATVDTEFKVGDDMLYAQYLRSGGDDVQLAWVVRRDPVSGSVSSDESTLAAKYHGVGTAHEFDLAAARHYGVTTLAAGGNLGIGGAVWRADLVLSDASDWTLELVTSLGYSWVWRDRNVTGAVEYYHNGYGQPAGRYDVDDLAENPELLARLARGQTFSIGRNQLAVGMTIEITPLWLLTPNVFVSLDDPSTLAQVVAQYSLGDNLIFLGAVNVPVGADGTEYGGIGASAPGRYFSSGAALFAQLAWYF